MLSPGRMFSVAMIQRLRLPPATRAMSADLQGESRRVSRGPGWSHARAEPAPALACTGRIAR